MTAISSSITLASAEASNAVELELPASPLQPPSHRRRHRKQSSLQQQTPVIYVELDRPSHSQSSDGRCSSSHDDEEIPRRSRSSLDTNSTDLSSLMVIEEKKTSEDDPLQSDGRTHGRRSSRSTCVTDWLGPNQDDDDHIDRLASLGALLQRSPNNHRHYNSDSDSDSDSVTPPYFAPSDFDTAHWTRTLQSHMTAPNALGAVLAIATALTHPWLFVVGALTALGTAHAAEAGYQYYYHADPEQQVGDAGAAVTKADTETSSSSTSLVDNRWFCWHHTRSPLTVQTMSEPELEDEPYVLEQELTSEQVHDNTKTLDSSSVSDMRRSQQQHAGEQDLSDDEWLLQHYPSLCTNLTSTAGERFVGLNAVEFFHVFYADEAPYNFIECQKKRGDVDICYGMWKDIDNEHARQSLHPKPHRQSSGMGQSAAIPVESIQERAISFKAKTNSLLGPPYATTTKTQRYIVLSKRLAILESRTTFADIPFYDRFCVMERWIIRAEKEETETDGDSQHQSAAHCYTCSVTASCQVVFMQSCPFEYQINRQASSSLVDVSRAWCAMAQEALKLAEQAKCDRLLRSEGHAPGSDTGGIETAGAASANLSDCGIEVDYVPQVLPVLPTKVDDEDAIMSPLGRLSKSLRRPFGPANGKQTTHE